MRISGQDDLPFAVDRVWAALLDPAVLVRTIPGCERLETLESAPGGASTYAMTVTAGVAAIRGTYDGTCALSELDPHRSLTMRLQGAGAPGTVDATVRVGFESPEEGRTRVTYDADAVVGGMVGGVGQRMLGSVSRRMAAEFLGNVAGELGAATAGTEPGTEARRVAPEEGAAAPRVFTAPVRPPSGQQDFLRGVAVGAGLVLLGVLAGGIFGRRRR